MVVVRIDRLRLASAPALGVAALAEALVEVEVVEAAKRAPSRLMTDAPAVVCKNEARLLLLLVLLMLRLEALLVAVIDEDEEAAALALTLPADKTLALVLKYRLICTVRGLRAPGPPAPDKDDDGDETDDGA